MIIYKLDLLIYLVLRAVTFAKDITWRKCISRYLVEYYILKFQFHTPIMHNSTIDSFIYQLSVYIEKINQTYFFY